MNYFYLNSVKILFFLIFFSSTCWSQKVVKSTLSFGGASKIFEMGHYVSSSLGQNSLVGHISLEGYTIYQGFQGPILTNFKTYEEFKVFPNSFNDHLKVLWKNEINNFVNIRIYNSAGILLVERGYFVRNNELFIENLNFNSGQYILILDLKGIYSKGVKIIKH